MMGRSSIEAGRILIRELDLPINEQEFLIKSKALYLEAFSASQLLPGAERLTRHLAAHNIPIGIATGSTRELYNLKTSTNRELFKIFDPIICTEPTEVHFCKPAPDIFLACAKKFSQPPASMSQCLVFEDAENGIRAALAAGMKVVFVPSLPMNAYDPDIIQQATTTLDSLLKFDPTEFGLPPFDDT
ncbi:unnamed protein product [Rotaria magnacalcarata]|uniref:Uncharacterized protein n=2 Tax=Rotaria magnacalcarata TaxID=392030 RepID=A0A819V5E6_9BILA|nr:unnamed protein product [Rotaria magnacalcarata]CAF2072719.1 unnamed protein product [Rotaria magnacalcarata]CAF2073268.1 unnamed protein product [Rotaria magnacalcarata]CAF2099113.1 unnamed protein product [Rotaria magnacalcarata]CAF3969204.1 unnamed protein product [Rotaria magnacalcarata]